MSFNVVINPFTGTPQLVLDGTILTFKAGVANEAALPSEGNTENDARITNDNGHLWVWDGSEWQDQGDVLDLTWAAITDKPSSSVANIDDAVSKRHTQGTDQKLDDGGVNEVTAANAKDAVTKKHTQNTDQKLDEGGENEVSANPLNKLVNGKVNPTNLLENGDFKLWSSGIDQIPDGWAAGLSQGSFARESTIILFGEYSCKLTPSGFPFPEPGALAQRIIPISGDLKWTGHTFTFGCWIYATETNSARIAGITGTEVGYSSYHTGNSTWQFLSVTGTMSGGFDQLELRIENNGSNPIYIYGATVTESSFPFAFSPKPLTDINGVITSVKADPDVSDVITKKHTQNTDTKLDEGGVNEVTAAQAKAGYTHSGVTTGNPHTVTKSEVGLGNVTNDAQLKRASGDLNSFDEKTLVSNNDIIIVEDSDNSYTKKKVKMSNINPVTKEIFIAGTDYNANIGSFRTRQTNGTGQQNFTFKMPDAYSSLISVELLGIISAGAAQNNRDIDLTSEYAAKDEVYNTNTESDSITTYNLSAHANKIYGFNLMTVLTGITPGDFVGINIDLNGVGGNIDFLGIKIKYI